MIAKSVTNEVIIMNTTKDYVVEQEFLTIDDVAVILKIGVETVRRRIKQGEIPGARKLFGPGSPIRVNRKTFLAWVNGESAQAQ